MSSGEMIGLSVEQALAVAPLLKELCTDDVAVVISDTECFLYYSRPRTFDLGIQVGQKLTENGGMTRAIRKGSRIVNEIGKEVVGVSHISVVVPITDGGAVVGAVGLVRSTAKKDELVEMATNLNGSIAAIYSFLQQSAAEAEELSSMGSQLAQQSSASYKNIQATDGIIQVIHTIASQTNMIGLNAAIEAARVGDAGRGFAVVADEVRKLASTTASSVQDINKVLAEIKQAISYLDDSIGQINQTSNEQADSLNTIMPEVEKLVSLAGKLTAMADSLTRDETGK